MNYWEMAATIFAINAFSFTCMWLDKQFAKRRLWRIPESSLLGLAILGGSPGVFFGMERFRHKSAKPRFYWRLTVILWVQLIALGVWLLMFNP